MSRFTFDTRSCTRCGGSGEYSWNAMNGSRCFKCHGKGIELTPAAARAKKAHAELRDQLTETTVDDIAVGDLVRLHRGDPLARVVSIEPDEMVVGGTHVTVERANKRTSVSYTKGYRKLWRALTDDERAQTVELLRNSKGVTEHDD